MKYRAEIDGLRALAVVPVILFHAGFELFSGGFVGVDVFFVISGYLITTILIEEIENKRFSIVNFYERRARRILPALFFVMLVCLPFAWMWMLPSQMKDFSQSLIAVSLFASNILFWYESGYFDAAAEEKPLLHTWSLAVEEQYYIFFPIFLILAWRFGKNRVFWIIVFMATISLLLSEWGWRNRETANFYLAPTRAWELFAGSIAAFIVQSKGVQKNNVLSLLGLAAIVFSIFAYDKSTPFPSVYALVPVLGAVLIVLYADKDTLAARVLSTKGFVGIGLISYSAYLWHQPLFAFARVGFLDKPSEIVMLSLSAASILLAIVSLKYIETPFRNKNKVRKVYVYSFSLIGFGLFFAIGVAGHLKDGFINRYTEASLSMLHSAQGNPRREECHFAEETKSIERKACVYFSGTPSVAVLGNSHGTELAYALAVQLKDKNISIVQHTISNCRHNYGRKEESDTVCYLWHQKVVEELIKDKTVKTVVLSYRNEYYLDDLSYRSSLTELARKLINSGKKVLLVLQAPLAGKHIDKYISHAFGSSEDNVYGLSRADWDKIYSERGNLLNELPSEVSVIDPESLFCDKTDCLVIKDGKALYFDDHHMSIDGAAIVAEFIVTNSLIE